MAVKKRTFVDELTARSDRNARTREREERETRPTRDVAAARKANLEVGVPKRRVNSAPGSFGAGGLREGNPRDYGNPRVGRTTIENDLVKDADAPTFAGASTVLNAIEERKRRRQGK